MKFALIFAAVLAVSAASTLRTDWENMEMVGEEHVVLPRSQLVSNLFDNFREIFQNGDASLGIPVLAPFTTPYMPLHLQLPNFIDLDLEFRNFRMDGLDSFVYNGGNFNIFRLAIDFDLTVPSMVLQGLYNANGNVFGLVPVFGNGNFRIEPRNIRIRGSVVVSNNLFGNVNLASMRVQVDPVQLTSNIDGLLTGGDLSVLLNAVIQDIIPQVMINFEPLVQDAINAIAEPIVSDLLGTFTFADLIGMLT